MYKRKTLKLDAVIASPSEIVPRDQKLREVIIAKMPANTTISLYFGELSDPIDISDPISFQPRDDDAERGLFWTNPTAQAGVSIDVIVVTGSRSALSPLMRRV